MSLRSPGDRPTTARASRSEAAATVSGVSRSSTSRACFSITPLDSTATSSSTWLDRSTSCTERTVADSGLGPTTTPVHWVRVDSNSVVWLSIDSTSPWAEAKKSRTCRRSAASRAGVRRRTRSTKKR